MWLFDSSRTARLAASLAGLLALLAGPGAGVRPTAAPHPASAVELRAAVPVSGSENLALLAVVKTARTAHCVAADARHHAWVCDPGRGRLLLTDDTLPASE